MFPFGIGDITHDVRLYKEVIASFFIKLLELHFNFFASKSKKTLFSK